MRVRRLNKGVAAVEFGIVLPVLLLVLFGIINYGVIMYNQAVITNAAREGARWAAIHNSASVGTGCANTYSASPTDACEAAYSYAVNNLINFGATGTLQLVAEKNPLPADFNPGTPQSIQVRYTYTGIGYYFGSTATTYNSTSVMLHE